VTPSAIVVLGARVRAGGSAGPALSRRLARAASAAVEWPEALVIVCGGRAWEGVVEADVMARALVAAGVEEARIVRDRLSLTTIENLREASALLSARKLAGPYALVSCDWHLPRALTIASALGLQAFACAATAPPAPLPRAIARIIRERFLRAVVPLITIAILLACRKPKPSVDAGAPVASASAPGVSSADLVAARVAADRRHSAGVPQTLSSGDVIARRAAARALSQIADAIAIERLGRSLSDEDPEVVAWSAYGLGLPCDIDTALPRDDRTKIVHAIVARAVSLEGSNSTAPFDPWSAMAWTLGRCGGLAASRELARWLGKDAARARAAAWALGSIAQRDKGLEDDVAHALLEAARAGVDDALFPFGRGDWSGRPPVAGLAEVARARLASGHAVAIRALGRAQGAKPEDFRGLLTDAATPEADRVEALRSLHRIGADNEVAAFATRNAPTDEAKTKALLGPSFGAVRVAIELLGERDPTATITTSLKAFTSTTPIPGGTPATIARRLATLRCLAAAALHPGKPGEAVVVRCAAHDPALRADLRADLDAIRDLARLQTLDRADITGDKRDLLVKLARDAVHRVRERAIGILGKHGETEEAPDVIIKAFSSKSLGVVASAAQAIADRPSIAQTLSKKAIDKALDPLSPPPEKVVEVDKSFDTKVLEALDGAIARPLEEADAEIKSALASAIGALKHARARGFVMRLCGDRSPALRRVGREALARLDPPGKAPACTTIDDNGVASPYASVPPVSKKLKIETDNGTMQMTLDPLFAPIAVARIAELAASGFYDGTPIHRVVPGFVVQMGDPTGDGYGGAHVALRCETAPVPFAEGDVGVALAGRDTGSSQIFVMLGRAPHLDGSYARIGHATGDWVKVAEGDHIVKVTVQ
jgi:cyclophilin family peptidyl-prolyl cis-trans isomerase/vancomycin permeability regulator SanA/HEAT repeat protein